MFLNFTLLLLSIKKLLRLILNWSIYSTIKKKYLSFCNKRDQISITTLYDIKFYDFKLFKRKSVQTKHTTQVVLFNQNHTKQF